MVSLLFNVERNLYFANRRNDESSLVGLGLLLFVLRLEATRLFDEGLGFRLVSEVVRGNCGDAEAKSYDDAINDTGDIDNRSPLLVSDTHRLECRGDGVEEVEADDEHANNIECSPARVCKHLDRGEPHVADDFALVVHVEVVFTELEHHEVLDEEAENEEARPDHGERSESLLALASIDFVFDSATSLLVFDFQLNSKENMECESSHEHQFNEVNHLHREVERVESGQEFGVGIVGCLGRSLVEIQELEVTTHVAKDEQGQESTCASHDLLLTNGRSKIRDDPFHLSLSP